MKCECGGELFYIEGCKSDDRYELIVCNECQEVYADIKKD